MTLGEYIKSYREMHGMSQRKFAALSGLTNTYISNLERGVNSNGSITTPSFETYQAVAKATNCTAADLVAFLDDPAEKTKIPAADESSGIEKKIRILHPTLYAKFARFLELAGENPDSAERFLSFAVQELESSKQSQ